jgi:hypothetical protein
MGVYQLPEPIEVTTSLGHGWALLIEAGGHEYWWTVALDTCALVTFQQSKIRIARSYTHSRSLDDNEMREIVR